MIFGPEWWEQHYQERGTGHGGPSAVLVAEVGDLPAGTALDAGCGRGADAVWLAARGWRVTAVDVSPTVIDAARRHTADVDWVVADLTTWRPPERYDLVVSQYVHPAVPFEEFVGRLAEAVAPGGTLLVVGHDHTDEHSAAHAPQRAWIGPEITAVLDRRLWETRVHQNGHDFVLTAHRSPDPHPDTATPPKGAQRAKP